MTQELLVRYVVILSQRTGPAPDVASLGGKIEFRQDDELVVTIPLSKLAALRSAPNVKYVEGVGAPPERDESALIGSTAEPSPGVSASSRRLNPQPLGNTPWDLGTYSYDGAGNIVTIGTDNYLYDLTQRLKQSSTSGAAETYTYGCIDGGEHGDPAARIRL